MSDRHPTPGGPVSPLAPHTATDEELRERMRADRAGGGYLVFRSADGRQRLLGLDGRARVTIGRRAQCDISVPFDARVSRLHAELVLVGSDWVITDDGLSSNGTWIGGRRLVGRHRLRDGNVIRVGRTLIEFCGPKESESATVASGGSSGVITISPAQRRVLIALCRPFLISAQLFPPTNGELAAELFLSVESIKTHLRALFEAFALDDVTPRRKRATLVERAVQLGVVSRRDLIG